MSDFFRLQKDSSRIHERIVIMKARSGILIICLLVAIASLPGCRYYYWVNDVAFQNQLDDDCYCCTIKYIRSLHIYDQFQTVAHFDALWLSDEIRTRYAELYADKRQLCPDRYHAFLRRQMEENQHFISFYVLAVIPGDLNHALLPEKNALWSVVLEVDGATYQPSEVKVVDLPPEYFFMFGKLWTRFKVPYLVKFDVHDVNGNPILTSSTNELVLVFATICRDCQYMRWLLNPDGTVIDDCRGANKLAYDL